MKYVVNYLFWLQAFCCPVFLPGLTGIFIGDEKLLYILLLTGVVSGVILAEWIRRKYGLDHFFSLIYGRPAKKANDGSSPDTSKESSKSIHRDI